MTFGLFPDEVQAARSNGVLMDRPDPGFFSGGLDLTMQGMAKTARAIDLAGAAVPIALDRLTGGTQRQDDYFREHDELFNRAVDYWTPEPGTVGKAGQIIGGVVPVVAQALLSPALAIGTAGLGTGEDLVRDGVPAQKAVAAAVAQAVGLGAGIAMPFYGSTLAAKALLGASSNVAQGIATKAVTQQILKGEKAADQYNPWEVEGVVIDALMGLAFGGLAHVRDRGVVDRWSGMDGVQRQDAWRTLSSSDRKLVLREDLSQSDKDALLVAQQARHLEDVTAPGRAEDAASTTAHVEAVRKAADDLLAGRQVNVDQIVQDARFAPDEPRNTLATEIHDEVTRQARQTVLDAMKAEEARTRAAETPGFLRTADDLVALKPEQAKELAPELQRAVEIARKPGALRTAEERIFLKSALEGHAFDALTKPIEPLARDLPPVEQPAPKAAEPGAKPGEGAEPPDPLLTEARQRMAVHGDIPIPLGTDENGNVITRKLGEMYDEAVQQTAQAKQDAGLFQVAASCMIGSV